jgi:putative transcriptional regulator
MLHSNLKTFRIFKKWPASISMAIIAFLMAALAGVSNTRPAFSDQHSTALPFRSPTILPLADSFQPKIELSKGKFLVANRKLKDPNFSETVVLLIDYHRHGAMGLVINRPTEMKLSKVFPEQEVLQDLIDTVHVGGPVARNQIFLLIRAENQPEGSLHIFDNIFVSSGKTMLQQMNDAKVRGEKFRVFVGYAGWAPGQLDGEISRGDWHVLRADARTIFDKAPSDVWPNLILRSSGKWTRFQTPDRIGPENRPTNGSTKYFQLHVGYFYGFRTAKKR